MKKHRSDADVMIDVLEEAARRSSAADEPPQLKQYGPEELPIVIDLIDSNKVRGDTAHVEGGLAVTLDGITLEGRQLRDELIANRDAKSWKARGKNFLLIVLGWIGGLLTTGAKALIEHLLNSPK
jgi:hypothetical protein